jgi:hypothetical protein
VGVLNISAKEPAIVLKLMDRCVEGAFCICSSAAGADRKAILIGRDDGEPAAFQLFLYSLKLRLRRRELFQIVVGEPMMIGGRGGIVECVDGLLECRFVLRLEMDGKVDDLRRIGRAEIARETRGGGDIILQLCEGRGSAYRRERKECGRGGAEGCLGIRHGFSSRLNRMEHRFESIEGRYSLNRELFAPSDICNACAHRNARREAAAIFSMGSQGQRPGPAAMRF